MKMKTVYTTFSLLLLGALLMSNENGRAFSQNKGNTGAPGDEVSGGNPRTCKSCHSAGAFSPTIVVELLNDAEELVTSYIPGNTYTAKVTITASGAPAGYGFQMTSLKEDGSHDVTVFNGPHSPNVRIATASSTGRSYVEQNGMSASNIFTATWIAPAAGSGTSTIYAAGNAVNGNNESGADGGATTTLQVSEMVSSVQNLATALGMSVSSNAGDMLLTANMTDAVNATLRIMTLQGAIVSQQSIVLAQGKNTLRTDASAMPSGLYLVSIELPNGQLATMKWVK